MKHNSLQTKNSKEKKTHTLSETHSEITKQYYQEEKMDTADEQKVPRMASKPAHQRMFLSTIICAMQA